MLCESDDEPFDDSDDDRDSNYEMSDNSHETELYDPSPTHVAQGNALFL